MKTRKNRKKIVTYIHDMKHRKKEQTERQRDRETERQRDRETERQRDRETERQRDRETERQRDRGTEGQGERGERERDTERQSDRETERRRDRETERRTLNPPKKVGRFCGLGMVLNGVSVSGGRFWNLRTCAVKGRVFRVFGRWSSVRSLGLKVALSHLTCRLVVVFESSHRYLEQTSIASHPHAFHS